jgi:hypothetical protein
VLARLVKRDLPGVRAVALGSPDEVRAFAAGLAGGAER